MTQKESSLIDACQIANQDPDIREIEEKWDGLNDPIIGPWEFEQAGEIR